MSRFWLLPLVALSLAACAHHPDVRRGENGINRVVVSNADTDGGTQDALSQARSYCRQKDKEPVFLNESSKYQGDIDEKTYKTAKKATAVAGVLGGAVAVFGGKKERGVGRGVLLGGMAGNAALGRGYQVEMRFRCE